MTKPNKTANANANARANANANANAPVDIAPTSAPTSGAEPSDASAPADFEANPPAVYDASAAYRMAGLRDHTRAGLRVLALAFDAKADKAAPRGAPAMLYVAPGALTSGLTGWPARLASVARDVCAASGVAFAAGAPVGTAALASHMARHGLDAGYLWGSYVHGAPKHAKAKAGTPAVLTSTEPKA